MNLEEFYTRMKRALDYFGLGWNDKELIEVTIDGEYIVFTYEDERLAIKLPHDTATTVRAPKIRGEL